MGDDKVTYTNYLCEACHVDFEYVEYPNEKPVLIEETLFNINIKDKEFQVKFHYGSRQTSIYTTSWVSAVSKHGGSTPIQTKHIFHIFSQLLDWTPFNAKDKLELLLPFF